MKPTLWAFIAVTAVTVAALMGCASTGPNSPSARPVLYPNAMLTNIGEPKARAEADNCMAKAQAAGLMPEEKTNAVAHGAAQGATVAGAASAVGAVISGRGLNGILGSAATGAAIGGTAGAVHGGFQNRPSVTYRHFVQRCLGEKGLDVIGWN
jgi:outer membrane lipoprotein SlyB